MASVAESLSPLLKTSTIRRGSLDLCQKLGNQFLSPRRNSLFSSPSQNQNSIQPNSSPKSPTSSHPFLTTNGVFNFNNEQPQRDITPVQPYHYKRRASDSQWIGKTAKVAGFSERTPENQSRRRLSLTPNLFSQLREPCETKRNTECISTDLFDSSHLSNVAIQVFPPSPPDEEVLRNHETSANVFQIQLPRLLDQSVSSESSDEEDDISDAQPSSISKDTCSRCCSGAKYDVDENLMRLVSTNYDLILNPRELLGKGSFGTVVGGVYHGKEVAVKVLKTTTAQRRDSVLGERNALTLPSHNHIAHVMDILELQQDKAIIIMEKMQKGNLCNLLNDSAFTIDCFTAINISKQIALALIFCHRQNLLHLDVKPQNILVDLRNCCKLSDFGSSKRINELDSCNKYSTLQGTVPYTAPELFTGSQPTDKCDVYSFAITMWQILSRELPYQDENEHSVIFRVVSQGMRPCDNKDSILDSLNKPEKALVTSYSQLYEHAWNPDPVKRPSMLDIHKGLIQMQFSQIF